MSTPTDMIAFCALQSETYASYGVTFTWSLADQAVRIRWPHGEPSTVPLSRITSLQDWSQALDAAMERHRQETPEIHDLMQIRLLATGLVVPESERRAGLPIIL